MFSNLFFPDTSSLSSLFAQCIVAVEQYALMTALASKIRAYLSYVILD